MSYTAKLIDNLSCKRIGIQPCSEHQGSALTPTAQRYGILVIMTFTPVGNELGLPWIYPPKSYQSG
jgi:hypothetical protein